MVERSLIAAASSAFHIYFYILIHTYNTTYKLYIMYGLWPSLLVRLRLTFVRILGHNSWLNGGTPIYIHYGLPNILTTPVHYVLLSDTWMCCRWFPLSVGLEYDSLYLVVSQFTLQTFVELVPPLVRCIACYHW